MNTKNTHSVLSDNLYVTDGGLETVLIFEKGLELPEFAAFPLLESDEGRGILKEYYADFIKIAKDHKYGYILESPTWRANLNWGSKLGYSLSDLIEINKAAIGFLTNIKFENEESNTPILISGQLGPKGDGYAIDDKMTIEEAEEYHSSQIQAFKDAGADMVAALTLNYLEEAVGIVQAAKTSQIPCVISFTTETNGKLPSGLSLKEAIKKVDELTDNYTDYYMINCAHPTHFLKSLNVDGDWINRIRGIRANASTLSHEELDESEHLDIGNRGELAKRYKDLTSILPNLSVVGGCCGTDHLHIKEICAAIS